MNFATFATWPELLAYAATGEPLYYHAPLNVEPVRIWKREPEPGLPCYAVRARSLRITPPDAHGRGARRTADPFTADKGHLDRFKRPEYISVAGVTGPFAEHLRSLGAVLDASVSYDWSLDTTVGKLLIGVRGSTVFQRFLDADRAHAAGITNHTGKWNFDSRDVEYWKRQLSRVMFTPDDSDDADDDALGCSVCGGPLVELGLLGSRKHFRCRTCGIDQSHEVPS